MSTYGSDRFLGASRIGSSLKVATVGCWCLGFGGCVGLSDWAFAFKGSLFPGIDLGYLVRENQHPGVIFFSSFPFV